ncbi:MAG: HAD family hydrolase, partial [Bryobacteraceae bacterium]
MSQPFVAFDLDDTLYLERDYVRSGFEAVGEWAKERLGIGDFTQRAWRWFQQGRRGDIFNQVLVEIG